MGQDDESQHNGVAGQTTASSKELGALCSGSGGASLEEKGYDKIPNSVPARLGVGNGRIRMLFVGLIFTTGICLRC